MELPRIGVWSGAPGRAPAAAAREAIVELEELGYGAFWYPEGFGAKESLVHAALLLSWTERLVVCTGIANVYARDARASALGAAALADAFPGRFVLGLGVSHRHAVEARGHEYGKPLSTMRAYLDAFDATEYATPPPAKPAPVVLAALGPRMLELARERTRGAHPYFVPVEHTRRAREILGPGPWLAPEQAVVLETDPARAREVARGHTTFYLAAPNYTNNLLRLGFAEEDFADGGSDRLVDAVVAWGDTDAVVARVRGHLDAGADHVCVQVLGSPPDELPLAALRELAPALLAR